MIDINLDDLVGGELGVQFQAAAKKVVENMLDPNTPYKNKRGITIKLTFEQNEERNDVAVGIQVDAKLSPRAPMKTHLSMAKDLRNGQLFVKEYGPALRGQVHISDYKTDENGQVLIEGKQVDQSTGEILN